MEPKVARDGASRVPMQSDGPYYLPPDHPERKEARTKKPGTITWTEHLEIWPLYDAKWNCGQSAEKVAERGGFSFFEAVDLGHEPTTWRER